MELFDQVKSVRMCETAKYLGYILSFYEPSRFPKFVGEWGGAIDDTHTS